ncbi:hypothetical protein ACEYYB_12425 [Paracoccus sp. p4-l81]
MSKKILAVVGFALLVAACAPKPEPVVVAPVTVDVPDPRGKF